MSPTRSPKTKAPAKKSTKKTARKARPSKAGAGKPAARNKAPAQAAAAPAGGKAPAAAAGPSPERARQEAAQYKEALAAYAGCMELLQKKDWKQASRALASFISTHQKERELNERARMYLRVCGQHLDASNLKLETLDDHCYVAVVLSNDGEYDTALKHLDRALRHTPESDKAMYLRASTLALKGDRRRALEALRKAISLDDRNRIYAANNPDFSSLRDDEEFITLTTREDEER